MSVQYTEGYHEYSGEYYEHTGGCSVHCGNIISTPGGYQDKCGGKSLGKQLNLNGNPGVLNIPSVLMISPRTHHSISPMYLWYLPSVLSNPDVLVTSPHCTHDIPRCTHGIPAVLNMPRCTHDIPRVLMISHSVLNDILPCTAPPSRCTAQTLCKVKNRGSGKKELSDKSYTSRK